MNHPAELALHKYMNDAAKGKSSMSKETMDRDARSSLNSLVRQNLLEKSLLSSDGLLYFEVIEEPFIHENPRVTSPTFVFVAFVFISWASSVLITYLRRYIV